jgi:hypothetical protein
LGTKDKATGGTEYGSGRDVKKTTKKAANETAKETYKGVQKVENKTQPN